MTLKDLKEETLDIDIIVKDKRDYEILVKALKKMKFIEDNILHKENIYKDALIIFKKEDSRIDIFIKTVAGMLSFTEKMQKRAILYKKYDKLSLYLSSD